MKKDPYDKQGKTKREADLAELWTDGACKGNPGGHSGAGAILKLPSGEIFQRSKYLGRMNSNEAEYSALLVGLEMLTEHKVKKVKIRTDSELMHHQIKGLVSTRTPSLIEFQERIFKVLDKMEWEMEHVPRTQNGGADILANRAAIAQSDREDVKYDPVKSGEAQIERLEEIIPRPQDPGDVGTPWGKLGAWPTIRPHEVMLMYDMQQGGYYVVANDIKILWLGHWVLPPVAQN